MMQHDIPRILNDEFINRIEEQRKREFLLHSNKNSSSRIDKGKNKLKLTTPHGKVIVETGQK